MLNQVLEGIFVDDQTGHLFLTDAYVPIQLHFKLVFIRHGETFSNCGQVTKNGEVDLGMVKMGIKDKLKSTFQGQVDSSINQLTETGRNQADIAVEKIYSHLIQRNWQPNLLLHSPLTRAYETCLPFVDKFQASQLLQVCNDIIEIGFGDWENKRRCDFTADDECHLFYSDQNALVKKPSKKEGHNSESFCDVILRADKFLRTLNQFEKNSKIIAFSHSVFGSACAILLGKCKMTEGGNYIAFDGEKNDGKSYTLPHCSPIEF